VLLDMGFKPFVTTAGRSPNRRADASGLLSSTRAGRPHVYREASARAICWPPRSGPIR